MFDPTMPRWKTFFQPSIYWRILAGFVLIIVLLVVATVVTYVNLVQIRSQTDRTIPSSQFTVTLRQYASTISQIDSALQAYFIVGGADTVDALNAGMTELKRTFEAVPPGLDPRYNEGLNDLKTITQRFEEALNQLLTVDNRLTEAAQMNLMIRSTLRLIDQAKQIEQNLSTTILADVDSLIVLQGDQINSTVNILILVTAVGLVLSIGSTWGTSRSIVRPIAEVASAASQIAAGKLDVRVPARTRDELGVLQRGINAMTGQLQDLVQSLESRVADRTRDLQLAAQVSRQITTELKLDALLSRLVGLIQQAFKLYHVNVYGLEAGSGILQLRAATWTTTEAIPEAIQRFQVSDQQGLIPASARELKPQVSNNVRQSPAYRANSNFPDTRSEAAFPMIFADQLIGVLDLQADQENRFTSSDLAIFQTLSEQIAVALHNADLFAEAETARHRAEKADQVKSAFLASVSHELRTPLNAIINFARFLENGMMGPVNESQNELLVDIVNNGEHLLSLINDVLDISKIAAGSLRLFVEDNVDLAGIMETVLSNCEALIGDRPIEIKSSVADNLPRIRCDRQRVLQIWLNIVSNACKFTQAGSIDLRLCVEGEFVHFTVQDTGPGIEAEDFESVFESFKQTRSGLRQGSGTGLGMPISKSLAEAHGGRIWFESTVGVGTTFHVELPVFAANLTPSI